MEQMSIEELKGQIAALDAPQKKILGAVVTSMFQHPGRGKEREWISEAFFSATLLAIDFSETADSAEQSRERAQAYTKSNIDVVLNAAYLLFRQVGEDMAPRAKAGFTLDDAVEQALSYFDQRPQP